MKLIFSNFRYASLIIIFYELEHTFGDVEKTFFSRLRYVINMREFYFLVCVQGGRVIEGQMVFMICMFFVVDVVCS